MVSTYAEDLLDLKLGSKKKTSICFYRLILYQRTNFFDNDEADKQLQEMVGNKYSIAVPHTVDCLQGEVQIYYSYN